MIKLKNYKNVDVDVIARNAVELAINKNSVKDSFPLVKHKTISIASNVRYFNTDNIAQRTPLFNIGLFVPDTYPPEGIYSLDLLNFTVTLTSTSGNVIGDPLTVDFLADKSTNIKYDSTSSTYSNWPNNSMGLTFI